MNRGTKLMTDLPDGYAAETPLTPRRLLVTALAVAALTSVIASTVVWVVSGIVATAGDGGVRSAGDVGGIIMGMLVFAFISVLVSFPVVLAALLLLALPLTLFLTRRHASVVARNLMLLAVAVAVTLLLVASSWTGTLAGWDLILPSYALTGGILWILGLRRLERSEAIAQGEVSAAFD